MHSLTPLPGDEPDLSRPVADDEIARHPVARLLTLNKLRSDWGITHCVGTLNAGSGETIYQLRAQNGSDEAVLFIYSDGSVQVTVMGTRQDVVSAWATEDVDYPAILHALLEGSELRCLN